MVITVIVFIRHLHAQIVGIARYRQVLACHPLRPAEAVLLHDRCTTGTCLLAHAATHGQRFMVILDTDRCVHRAEEELQIG
uniref:Putative secreted peptide n=1 Tax=Anopheles braziliensis TaxID=58242 RepID=A0A2M3ZW32_9DIPT